MEATCQTGLVRIHLTKYSFAKIRVIRGPSYLCGEFFLQRAALRRRQINLFFRSRLIIAPLLTIKDTKSMPAPFPLFFNAFMHFMVSSHRVP